VGIRGSSQPRTWPSFTRRSSTRLDSTVWVSLSRANSYWWGTDGTGRCPISQSYSGRWTSNSRVQIEWVTPSIASDWPWAKS
jgi:hypothetical protein